MKKTDQVEAKQEVAQRPREIGFVTISREKIRKLQESLQKLSFICMDEIAEIEGWLA